MGLAYRKLDIFGYYKFVTAVRNINLLPNRDTVRQQNKIKFLSGFAFKGLAITIAIAYFVLISYSDFGGSDRAADVKFYSRISDVLI